MKSSLTQRQESNKHFPQTDSYLFFILVYDIKLLYKPPLNHKK